MSDRKGGLINRMIDINEKLNGIIFKYQLDKYYPHYKNMYHASKILGNIIKEIIHNKKKAIFVGDDKAGIEWIRNISGDYADIDFCLYDRMDKEPDKLKSFDCQWGGVYEEIYLISFYGAAYVERWFRLHNVQYKLIYDIFEQEGIFLQREFFAFGKENLYSIIDPEKESHSDVHCFTESIQGELYCQENKYYAASDQKVKRIALEKCLFLTLYMKNFIEAQKYMSLLAEEDAQYKNIWDEIQDLLNDIKENMGRRREKDIVVYWMDAISYGDETNMPYLKDIMRKSVVFENAYTHVPFTHPALRAMFLGKKEIDDLAYRISECTKENSPVIRMLEEQGYHLKIMSEYFYDYFPVQYRCRHFYTDIAAPFSMKLWDMLAEMLLGEQKALWVIHEMDSHIPYLINHISDQDYKKMYSRYSRAREEVDAQLAFYESFIHHNSFRIYMSDHGTGSPIQRRVHILFNVYHDMLQPRQVQGLFSILDFGTVVKQIVMEENVRPEDLSREYVEIANLDRYNRWNIEKIIKNKEELGDIFFGFKGIIDKDYIYIQYRMGKEWLQPKSEHARNPFLFYNCEDEVCSHVLLPKYRELAGTFPECMDSEEKFQYTKYLYRLYRNILQHSSMERRVEIMNQIIEKYPESSVAIRQGGYHSAMLYYVLSKENRKKIWGFIDNSKECRCKELQLPVVPLHQMGNFRQEIKAVILSSYIHQEELRKESASYPSNIQILDFYDEFERNGVKCEKDFWRIKGMDEDYDVGFPFDEK